MIQLIRYQYDTSGLSGRVPWIIKRAYLVSDWWKFVYIDDMEIRLDKA